MKAFRWFLNVIVVWSMHLNATAQTIQGRVIDTDSCAVDGATVILQSVDSAFVEASITNSEGYFLFHNPQNNFRLIIQHLLYHTFEKTYADIHVGNIVLSPKDHTLKEIVVKGERPLVTVKGDRLAYDIPQLTADKLVTNAYEAIRKVPGILEQEGTLTLAGAGKIHLILNGHPSSMSYEQIVALLKSTPASRLEQIEIMYTTPPQYHVRGASINIRLKNYKKGEGGLQGEVSGNYVQQNEAGGGGGLSLAHMSPKLDVDFMYHVNNMYTRQGNELKTKHIVNEELYNINQYTDGDGRKTKHTWRLGSTYKFNENSSLSADYTASFTPENQSNLRATGNLFQSQNIYTDKVQMHNASLNYISGFGLNIGVDYTNYSNKEEQAFSTYSSTNDVADFISQSNQNINRLKIYTNQKHSLSSFWEINYGAFFAFVSNQNKQKYNQSELENRNTDSKIYEYTYNIYSGFKYRFSQNLDVSTSIALEYYKMMDYKKWAVYPMIQGNYIISPSHILQLSFSSDKTYPDYWVLGGATTFLNNYQLSVGNTALKPYTNYSGNLTYILKRKYIFRLSYSYKPDYFTQMVYLNPSQLQVIYNFQNWDYMSQFGLTSVLPFKLGEWWDSQLVLNLMLKHDKAESYFDAPFNNKKWIGVGMWDNTFTLSGKPNIKLELTAFGQTEAIQGSYIIRPLGGIDMAIRYTLPNGNAMLQLKANDIFNSKNPHTKVRNGNQWLDMTTKEYERALTLSFSYKFKGYKETKKQDMDISRFGF